MMTKNYTPGDFVAKDGHIMHPEKRGVAIAAFGDEFKPVNGFLYGPESDANQLLFSAAPELVEASQKSLDVLRDYLERMTDGDCDPVLVAEIKNAIESTHEALIKAGVLTQK